MSRCFPFPPPGYEKKARTNDVDLLDKEKQKEESHKEKEKEKEKKDNKEKKDKDKKEKREKKEKKAKDRSEGKHKDKDKKDKKEKHKDKKKEKGRDKEKEKDRSNNSEEKKFPGHPDGQNVEKISDEKKLPGKSEGHSGEKFIEKEKGRDKGRSSFSGEKKLAGHISGYNGEKIGQNSHMAEDFRDSKFVQELAGRVRDEVAGTRSQLVDKFTGSDWKKGEQMVSFVAKTANKLAEEKEKTKKSVDRKFDLQGIKETRAGGNAMVSNIVAAAKARVEGIPKQAENITKRLGEEKEKIQGKEGDDKIRDRRKDKDGEKKSHRKDKDRDKAKEEKEKAKGEHRNLELDNLKGDEPPRTISLKTSHPFKEGNKDAVAEENLHKRKDLEKNGFFHVDVKPNKLPQVSSSQPLTVNGKTLESCQGPISHTLDSKEPGTNLRKRKANGIIDPQLPSVSPAKHLSSSAQASQIDEVSIKPPHPDSKYLNQVLTVPKMEECSDFEDQSWLFQSTQSQLKKPKVGFSEIDEPPQVWAEALQIESVDVYACPYVIPY